MSKKPENPFNARKRAEQARRRLAEAARLAADRREVFEMRMAETRARLEQQRDLHEQRMAELAERLAEKMGRSSSPKSFRKKRPPKDEGGEAVPVMPRPKPKPLTGGAAAPLDPDRRRPADGASRRDARRSRVPSDAESRQSL